MPDAPDEPIGRVGTVQVAEFMGFTRRALIDIDKDIDRLATKLDTKFVEVWHALDDVRVEARRIRDLISALDAKLATQRARVAQLGAGAGMIVAAAVAAAFRWVL